ncbi:MAG: DsrE/DsrF/DrsH-like family protein [Halobacteriota archaeon]|nr:DsrE/DsrF/DrsH-like family protein [Halobacteriota archaeon]
MIDMVETKKLAMVVAEGTFDKSMMPFIMGVTAASMGWEVHVFFTFFGLSILKKGAKPKMGGIYRFFTGMMENRMKKVGVEPLSEQIETAKELGMHLYACSTSMSVMGVTKEDLIDGAEIVGAAKFLDLAADSDVQLFIG